MHIHMSDSVHDCLGLRILGCVGKPFGEVLASDPVLHFEVDGERLASKKDVEHPPVFNMRLAIEKDPADKGEYLCQIRRWVAGISKTSAVSGLGRPTAYQLSSQRTCFADATRQGSAY